MLWINSVWEVALVTKRNEMGELLITVGTSHWNGHRTTYINYVT